MIPSSHWFGSTLGPAFANHLWQSTLFVAAAAVLTLLVRRHSARLRWWLWLAASLKFLVPFSALVDLGSRLSWRHTAASTATPVFYVTIEEISRPFTAIATNAPVRPAPVLSAHIPEILFALWLAGFLAILVLWTARWLRIAMSISSAHRVESGRELSALRRIERIGGIRRPIPLLLSTSAIEPGVFGIFRPVLLWPDGISHHLDDANLEAIVAHEVWHVRRRDNLFATVHMLIEAIFWFYPLVWWLGARLLDERERACDEEVVALGNNRQIYAESILKVCEFCLGSPLPCVSGVTGADLKKRMVHIMNDRIMHKLDFARKFLLTTAAFLTLALPITFGLLNATPSQAQAQSDSAAPVFDSVSITPSTPSSEGRANIKMKFSINRDDRGFAADGVTIRELIKMAYHLQKDQLAGGPDWLDTARFDIEAKLKKTDAATTPNSPLADPIIDDQPILRAILANYFKVSFHTESRNLEVYELTSNGTPSGLTQVKNRGMLEMSPGEFNSGGVPFAILVDQLSTHLHRVVVDKTGLTGNYAFSLRWTPTQGDNVRFMKMDIQHAGEAPQPAPVANQAPAATLVDAVREQLGLNLESKTEPTPVMVVDHAEPPAQN